MDEQTKYPQYPQMAAYEAQSGISGAMERSRHLDITLRQNINERIKQAQTHVAELEATKDRMERSGILDMRIDDIRRAMQL